MAISRVSVCFVLGLLATPFLAKAASPCPTVTKTTHHSYCPSPTPSICAQPDCILLSRLDVPCGCPTVVPTSTSYTACPTACTGACGTDYETIIEPCSTTSQSPTSPTTISTSVIPSSCATITETTGTGCPTLTGCTTEECIVLETVTLECGCASIYTQADCLTACKLACQTTYETEYLPCPLSATTTAVTTGGDVTATRTGSVISVPTA